MKNNTKGFKEIKRFMGVYIDNVELVQKAFTDYFFGVNVLKIDLTDYIAYMSLIGKEVMKHGLDDTDKLLNKVRLLDELYFLEGDHNFNESLVRTHIDVDSEEEERLILEMLFDEDSILRLFFATLIYLAVTAPYEFKTRLSQGGSLIELMDLSFSTNNLDEVILTMLDILKDYVHDVNKGLTLYELDDIAEYLDPYDSFLDRDTLEELVDNYLLGYRTADTQLLMDEVENYATEVPIIDDSFIDDAINKIEVYGATDTDYTLEVLEIMFNSLNNALDLYL